MLELRYCRDKVIYSKRDAQEARNRRFEEAHIKLRIYPCSWCNGWHLTSKNTHLPDGQWSKEPKFKTYRKRGFQKSEYSRHKKFKSRPYF